MLGPRRPRQELKTSAPLGVRERGDDPGQLLARLLEERLEGHPPRLVGVVERVEERSRQRRRPILGLGRLGTRRDEQADPRLARPDRLLRGRGDPRRAKRVLRILRVTTLEEEHRAPRHPLVQHHREVRERVAGRRLGRIEAEEELAVDARHHPTRRVDHHLVVGQQRPARRTSPRAASAKSTRGSTSTTSSPMSSIGKRVRIASPSSEPGAGLMSGSGAGVATIAIRFTGPRL